MKLWGPWREKTEERQQLPYTDTIIDNVVAAAEGSRTGDAAAIAALEACAALYSHAFASAELGGDGRVLKALSPPVRALIGRELIRRGESVWTIEVSRSGLMTLEPVGFHHVRGGISETEWLYWCSRYGPSGTLTRTIPGQGVCHFRYSTSTVTPWRGVPPLGWSSQTSQLAGAIEERLAQEAQGPSGYLIAIPEDGGDGAEDDPLAQLKQDISGAKGRTVLTETTAGGYTDKDNAPKRDWVQSRFGADPPDVLRDLRTDTALHVADACGVPRALIDSADGTAAREGWRRFVMGAVEPLARIIEAEIETKLESRVRFNFRSAWAHDLQGRTTAFQKLVAGGMDVEKAATISGVIADDT